MKINLGCGEDIRHGYINIDKRALLGVDRVLDISKGLPYEDGECSEVIARDVLEHFSWRRTDALFAEWVRVLRTGGTIEICVPNIDRHFAMYWDHEKDRGKRVDLPKLRRMIFGCQRWAGDFHMTTFNTMAVKDLFNRNNIILEWIQVTKKSIEAFGRKDE